MTKPVLISSFGLECSDLKKAHNQLPGNPNHI